jgi:hypothetical protein
MEVADDLGLGIMMKNHGARQGFYLASEHVSVRWYETPGDMIRGLEKNAFSMDRYSYARLLFTQGVVWSFLMAPLLALFPWGIPFLWLGAAVPAAFLAAQAIVQSRVTRDTSGAAFLIPLGIVAISFAALRSAWKCRRRGGIVWRGRSYPLEDLRNGQRVKF